MRIYITFILVSVVLPFSTVSIHAQSSSPARKLARFGEKKEAPPDSTVDRYRLSLRIAAQYSKNQSVVVDSLISGVQKLRRRGLSVYVLDLLSIDGLGGLVSRERPFEAVLDTYLTNRINKGLGHERAIKRIEVQ